MRHPCPKCAPRLVIYQPAKRRYWCPGCSLNYTLREVALVVGGKA